MRCVSVTDINAEAWVSSSHRPMGFPEFVVVIASIMALNPLAMDMMLPALPNIASAFHITIANRPQAVLLTFLIGFGVGQFVMGPLSDRFGRRPVLIDGMALYCIASMIAITASSFETLLLARVLQGLGTSATRVIATSIVRDCYAGRRMASVMSLAMMVFIAVPVVPPVVRSGGVVADAVARDLHRADALRSARADLERAADAGDLADVRAQVAGYSQRARRLASDRDQPADPGLCAGGRRRAGVAVRLRVLVGAGVHRNLRARALLSAGVRSHRDRRGRRWLSQCPFRWPPWHAGDFSRRTGRLRGGGRDHAAGGENVHSAAAALHGAGGAADVRVRADVRQFHVACDGATGPYRRHGVVVVRVDHDAAWHWHRHHDRPGLRRHAFAVCDRVFPLHAGFPGGRACGGKGPAVQASRDASIAPTSEP